MSAELSSVDSCIRLHECQSVERSQLAGSNRPYEIDIGTVSVSHWLPGASIAPNELIRPTMRNETGFVYQNSATSGQTGQLEPAWPTTAGATVQSGSLTLTAMIPPAIGEDVIASATWTQQSPPDAALTITNQSNTSLVASAYIGGGTSGNVYVILASVTMASGAVYPVQIFLTIL